jgi:hypothetical protein
MLFVPDRSILIAYDITGMFQSKKVKETEKKI